MSAGNIESLAYNVAEGTPWHGLGNPVEDGATVEQMLKAGGLDWEVLTAPVRYYLPGSNIDGVKVAPKQMTDDQHFVLFRADTGAVLDIVGRGYVPTQNAEILEFFREYVEAGDMRLDTVGALDGGRRVWAQAIMDRAFELPGGDVVEGRVLLANPHIYGKGMVAKFCATRVVCQNTWTQALSEGSAGEVKLWHNRAFDEATRQEAKRRLGIARERMDAFEEVANRLTELSLDPDVVARLAARVFGVDEDRPLEKQTPTVKRIVALWEGEGMGADLPSAKGTAWGAFSAFTQYQDWEYGRSQDRRMQVAWFGRGELIKRRALEELSALLG